LNYLKTEKLNYIGANSPQEIKYTIGLALEKGFGENGMNVACGMEMSISPKLRGAEVYACNVGKMKCWFGLRYETDRNEWRRNGTHLPQAHGYINSTYFIYCTTIGRWGN